MKYFTLPLILILFSSCVQETHTKTVTFKVDMTFVENVSNVGIRGDFTDNPWTQTAPLTDDNNDGIYEGTFLQKTAINQIQFKFVNQGGDYELKGTDNRVIEFEYNPEIITYEAIFDVAEAKITKE